MINRRRPAASTVSTAPPTSSAPTSTSPSKSKSPNSAYVPLRRPSAVGTNGATGYAAPLSPPLAGSSAGYPGANVGPGVGVGAGPGAGPGMGHSRGYGAHGSLSFGSYGGSGFPFGADEDELKPPPTPMQVAARVLQSVKSGVLDAARLDRSWGLVWGDMELRALVIKLTLLNLLSLTLLSLFPLVLSPIIDGHGLDEAMATRASQVSLWYNVLLSWPAFAVIFWVNSLWGPGVARRAQTLLHPAYRHQPTSSIGGTPLQPSFADDPAAWAWMAFTRLLLIADFTLVFRVALLVPVLGWPLGLGYMALINAYYGYEWIFVSRAWGLDFRCTYIADRTAYMFGFGLPATLLTTFGPPMVNMAVFTLIYPFLLIQALQSRPPTAAAILPSTPSTSAPLTPTSSEGGDMLGAGSGSGGLGLGTPRPRSASPAAWLQYARVPVFFFARNVLLGSRFLVDAVMRERGGYAARMRGKRAS